MKESLLIVQIVVAVLLVIAVSLQNRGTGTGAVFGGGNQVARAKRGPEKTLHYITISLGVIFFALSFYISLFLTS
jgi:protein translocase SecG subunit